ncbi:hypothetical protein N473_20575 [Pseudoalteromonas luteoviolacea CPMOR-1]|uniref:Uncharacterized protein n=1 Tax=Pseudoalteromonas luteoviolacea CPMOR-1 TaxID=1365248 RepID=A0A162BGZ6_9GAMM|nr:hypothetical protein [Pseudoalteromonas luteoviolacea]KZN61940.1 hypothetical protein N473_20575 [Pseudoalteromonas luteoviolacea CPMOR-1]
MKYRVRLKLKTKIKLAVLAAFLITFVSVLFWSLVHSELFQKQDLITYRQFSYIKPFSYGLRGSRSGAIKVVTIKPLTSAYVELVIQYKPNEKGEYCIGKRFKNGRFDGYSMAHTKKCL